MNWIAHWAGLDNGSGPIYLFWSGIFSALPSIGVFGVLIGAYRKHNCHIHGCWRIGRHPHGRYVLCAKHHPEGAPTVDSIESEQQFQEQILAEVREVRNAIQRGGFGLPDPGKGAAP